MNAMPDRVMIIGKDGLPESVIDVDQLQADATMLMFAYAAASDDVDELDRIGTEWSAKFDPDYFGYVAAGALSLLVRNVLEPVLEVLDEALPHVKFRQFLRDSRDNANNTL